MKTSRFFGLFSIVLAIAFSAVLITACGHDEPEVPSGGDEPEVPSGRDELSNTSWKLVSITGWAASESSTWSGEILSFGSSGTVSEVSVDGSSKTGTYTLNDGVIKFDGIYTWTNEWGSSFYYTISGNTLTLKDDLGSLGSTFKFSKL